MIACLVSGNGDFTSWHCNYLEEAVSIAPKIAKEIFIDKLYTEPFTLNILEVSENGSSPPQET